MPIIELKERLKSKKFHYIVFCVVLLCGVVTSAFLYLDESNQITKEESLAGTVFVKTLGDELSKYEAQVSSVVSLMQSSKENVTSIFFSNFIQGLSTPSGLGFYFAQYVPDSKRYIYESMQKNTFNNDDFIIFPEGNRKEYLPFALGYPDQLNYGFDLISPEYPHADSIALSRNSLQHTLSEPMSLSFPGWGGSDFPDIFVLRLPVYLSLENRADKFTDSLGFYGLVGAYFRIDTVLNNADLLAGSNLLYRMADVTSETSPVWFVDSVKKAEKVIWNTKKYNTNYLSVAGRKWRVDTFYKSGVASTLNLEIVLLPLIFSFLLASILAFYVRKFSAIYDSALVLANKRIEFDELTGLFSRSRIQKILNELATICKKEDKWLATLILDLDHFKTINDVFGHEIGDKLLAKVAQRLVSSLPDEAVVGYLGGDCFLVLLTENETQDKTQLNLLVKEIILQISQSYFVDGRTLNIGCSIGVALAPDFGENAVTLIKNADMAVYQAKSFGRATYHFYDGEMGKQLARNVRIESRLREAIQNEEGLELHFQPKVDIVTERCVGMEALLRWNDEELGPVSPAEFIPVAEQTGVILLLGEWVFEQAFRHILEWQEQGICVPPIAINCSAAQLKRIDFLPNLLALLDKYKIDPSLLEIEVTESILIEDAEGCAELLRQISRLGMKLSIDDFGTGYSSLSYLKDLPFDYLKIDQVFIRNIVEDRNDAALTHAIIVLGHNLNLKVIAEGITDIHQLIMLQEFGCDIGQGYLFSKALGASSMRTDPMIMALNEQDSV